MTITETFWSVGNHYRTLNSLFLQFKYTCHFDPALRTTYSPCIFSRENPQFSVSTSYITLHQKAKIGFMNSKGFYSSYPVRKSFLRKLIIFDCAHGNVVQLSEGHESRGSSPSKSYDIIRLGPPTFQGVNGSSPGDQGAVRALFLSWLQ